MVICLRGSSEIRTLDAETWPAGDFAAAFAMASARTVAPTAISKSPRFGPELSIGIVCPFPDRRELEISAQTFNLHSKSKSTKGQRSRPRCGSLKAAFPCQLRSMYPSVNSTGESRFARIRSPSSRTERNNVSSPSKLVRPLRAWARLALMFLVHTRSKTRRDAGAFNQLQNTRRGIFVVVNNDEVSPARFGALGGNPRAGACAHKGAARCHHLPKFRDVLLFA